MCQKVAFLPPKELRLLSIVFAHLSDQVTEHQHPKIFQQVLNQFSIRFSLLNKSSHKLVIFSGMNLKGSFEAEGWLGWRLFLQSNASCRPDTGLNVWGGPPEWKRKMSGERCHIQNMMIRLVVPHASGAWLFFVRFMHERNAGSDDRETLE